MKIRYILFLCVILLSSCGTIKKIDGKAVDIDCNVTQYPTVAELNIKEKKVSGSIEWEDKWFGRRIPVQVRKGNLIAEVSAQAGADVLVEPQFIFEQGSRGLRSRKLSVSGYPATFKNFRPATPADIELLKLVDSYRNMKLIEKYEARPIQGIAVDQY